MKKRFCGNCGTAITNENARFCSNCGAPVNRTEDDTGADTAQSFDMIPRYDIVLSNEQRLRIPAFPTINYSNITARSKISEFVAIDIETTGLDPAEDRIVELGAVHYVDGIPVTRFQTFVNPQRPMPSDATRINKITDDMLTDAPTIEMVLPSFEEFIGDSALVGHNLEFDLKFLFHSGSNIITKNRRYYDTLAIARKMLKKPRSKWNREDQFYEADYDSDYDVEDHKLGTLCGYYGIVNAYKHRADSDACATGTLFLRLQNDRRSRE